MLEHGLKEPSTNNTGYRFFVRVEKAMWRRQYKNNYNRNEDTSCKCAKTEIVQMTILKEF